MEPSKDAITVRLTRLHDQIVGKTFNTNGQQNAPQITKEALLDALQVLYDECNTDYMKVVDQNIANFVDKYRKAMLDMKRARVNISDFEVKSVIGRGQFGEVHVVREKQTGDVYAMKTVRKTDSVTFEEEKHIMAIAHSPWITILQYAFQDCNNLYFVMEYHPGGDLLGLLYRQGGTIPESAANFYISELILALNYLHKLGFVHRDIKPDNILLDRCGHLKLADFGSAARLDNKGFVIDGLPIGTPDYIAPEVLQSMDNKNTKKNKSYGTPCDYWSLGILAYELTVGATPFSGPNTTTTYANIMNHPTHLKLPPDIILSHAYTHLIKHLLTHADQRLSHATLVTHPLFAAVDFTGLREQVPPYVPRITASDDTSNFSDVQGKRVTGIDMANLKRKTQFTGRNLPFVGFSYARVGCGGVREVYCGGPVMVKDELVVSLKRELDGLRKKVIGSGDWCKEKESFERKLEDKIRKLESIETLRDRLERDLANSINESAALRRTLDFERKDRSQLELKALEIIKNTKSKWEASEKIKVDALNKEIDELKETISDLLLEKSNLTQELQKTIASKNEHKKSVESVEKFRRSSVIGLENRLEKVTSDTQRRISQLQCELSSSAHEKNLLEKEVSVQQDTGNDLKEKLQTLTDSLNEFKLKRDETNVVIKEFENKVFNLKTDNTSLKKIVEDLRQQNLILVDNKRKEVENSLQREIEKNSTLKRTINDLKSDFSAGNLAYEKARKKAQVKFETEHKQLQAELSKILSEKTQLRAELDEALVNDENNRVKVKTLEELLARLENGVSKLESGSTSEAVLQDQIKRLETQFVEVHETLALEKHEHSQLKTKHWRLEKDLSNAELDRKIVERDLKDSQVQINSQLTQLEHLQTKLDNNDNRHEDDLSHLYKDNQLLKEEVESLKTSLGQLGEDLCVVEGNLASERMRVEVLRKDVQGKEFRVCSVLAELSDVREEVVVLQGQVGRMREERSGGEREVEVLRKERVDLDNRVEKLKQELENSTLNRAALRDACTILEDQLTEFEHLYTGSESKRSALSTTLIALQSQLDTVTVDVRSARTATNEANSLRHRAESRAHRAETDLVTVQGELAAAREEVGKLREYMTGLSGELRVVEGRLSEEEVTRAAIERQLEECVVECRMLKEEGSEQRTVLAAVRESGYRMGHQLMEVQANSKALVERIKELECLLDEKVNYYEERDMKSFATMQQQTKLIDFLQSKVEESNKKKKTLSDKLFGHSKKENQPPSSVALNYKDLEAQLGREREQSQKLRSEIVQLKSDLYAKSEIDMKADAKIHLNGQCKVLEQIVQSPASQKNDLYRQNSVQRMHHNIPHRFETKLCTKSVKCAQCSNQIQLGRNFSTCRECNLNVHSNCSSVLPRTCGLPQAYAKHYKDSLTKLSTQLSLEDNKTEIFNKDDIHVEGWVKIPIRNSWEKHYACLTSNCLRIFAEPPNTGADGAVAAPPPVQSLVLLSAESHGKVVLEPVASEIGSTVANSDLPFVMKVDVIPNTTCWPANSLIFMTLSIEDKDKWFKALDTIFKSTTPQSPGDVILTTPLEINSIIDLAAASSNHAATVTVPHRLLATASGLYAVLGTTKQLTQESKGAVEPLHIMGPLQVHDVTVLPSSGVALMIVDDSRALIQCDLHHLVGLTECAPCSKPTLQFKCVQIVNNHAKLDGFHIIRTSTFTGHNMACAATDKHLVIMTVDLNTRDIIPLRILDTAEPTSCLLFTALSLIIGADKFFEIDLTNFAADEFLDTSDTKLTSVVHCYQHNSFPIAILPITSGAPREYIVAFNEFALFVDEFGRSTRSGDITWSHIPLDIHYAHPYLYVVHFAAVEIIKISPAMCTTTRGNSAVDSVKIELDKAKFLGGNSAGIYVSVGQDIRFISGRAFDDTLSMTSDGSSAVGAVNDEDMNNSDTDRFSFTSSMVRSLDGHLSDVESVAENDVCHNRKVKFATETRL